MSKTFLQTVNQVLEELREDDVSTVNQTEYSRLIGSFVNRVLDKVQGKYTWHGNDIPVTFDTVVDQTYYDLTATVGNGGDVTSSNGVVDDTGLLVYDNERLPLVFNTTDDPPHTRLRQRHFTQMRADYHLNRYQGDGRPEFFSIQKGAQGASDTQYSSVTDGWKVHLNPPQAVYEITTYWNVQQPQLERDGTDDSTIIRIPNQVVYAGALMYAANERGEEIGEPGNLYQEQFTDALAAAREIEDDPNIRGNLYEFFRE